MATPNTVIPTGSSSVGGVAPNANSSVGSISSASGATAGKTEPSPTPPPSSSLSDGFYLIQSSGTYYALSSGGIALLT